MKKVFCILTMLIYIIPNLAMTDSVKRPGANNKMGLTKKTPEEKENSFVNRILRGDFDNSSIIEKDEIKEIKTEIEKLKAQNNNQIDNEKIIKQIKMLSDLKDEGILTESEFIDKKRILLDKLK